jgi:hypothetical protein
MPVAAPMGRGPAPTKRAKGKPAIVGGTGNKDSELALLMPGETVIPTKMSQKYGGIINAMIADRVPGYKRGKGGVKNPGMFKAVDIPGGYDASHFGGSSYATGQELLNMVDGLNDTISKNIKKMVMSFEDGLTKTFTTFDNRVVAQDTSINRDMKYKGSVDIFRARENLTGKGFSEVRDIQLQKELTDAGMSIDEYKKVNKQITTEIVKGFDALGSKTTVTSDELDKLLRNSYDAVAKTDTRIQEANNRLRAITTVTDPKTSSRIAINPQSYRLNRADSEFNQQGVATRGIYALGMDKVSGPGKSPYSPYSRIGFKAASANALGLSLQDSTRVFNQFSKDVKVRLSLLKDDVDKFTTMFVAEAEKSGIKSGNSYKVGIDKSTLKDIYVESRERQSPHPLAPKDGKDDARAYAIARDKELKKQSGRQPGAATRGQGPAPIGATPQPGMTVLPIVPGGSSQTVDPNNPPTNNPPTNNLPTNNKTILQRLGGAVKGIGGKITGMGGGMGLLGLNMGLSMAPDFAGKGIAQSTTTGASLGMFLGPKGTAVGAGIGFATSSLSALNKKIKEYGEVNKSVFTISNSLITAFGDKVLDTKVKVTELSKSSVALRDKFGLLSPQVQAIIDDLKKLPEDDPLAIFIKSISTTGQSLSEVTGNLRSKLTTDISIGGLDPENAQKYIYTLMVAAGKANEFGAVWKSISKDVVDVSTATEASFNKVGDAVNMAGGSFTFLEGRTGDVAKDYDELRDSAKTLSDQMFSFFGVLSNGAFTYDQIQERLQAFSRSSVDAKSGVLALQAAVKASSDPILIERFALIERIIKESGKAATATAADYTMMHLALEMLGKDGKNLDSLRTDLFPDEGQRALARRYATDAMLLDSLMKGKDFKEYINELAKQRKALDDALNGGGTDDYKDYEDGVDGLSASSKAYLDILEKEIKGLEEKRDAQKNANDETQRQIDLQEKLADLAKKSILAKISGDYLEAASLQQQAQNVQVEFNQETELRKKDAEIARLRSRAEAIGDGAPLTRAEAAKIPKKVKAASGGMIRGAGTGTSDSIPAYLSNGEYVIKADSVRKYGVGTFDALNTQKFKDGGLASRPKYGTRSNPEEKGIGRFFKKSDRDKWTAESKYNSFLSTHARKLAERDKRIQEMLNKSPLTSWMGAEGLGTSGLLKSMTGQGTKSDKVMAALFPLNFMGMGSAKGALAKPASGAASKSQGMFSKLFNLPQTRKAETLLKEQQRVAQAAEEARKTAEAVEFLKNNPRPVRPGAPGAPPPPPSVMDGVWGDLGSDFWDTEATTEVATKTSRIKDAIFGFGRTIARPITTPANFVSGIGKGIKSSFKYGRNENIRWDGTFDYLGRDRLMREAIDRVVGPIGNRFNPRLTLDDKIAKLDPSAPIIDVYSKLQKLMSPLDGRPGSHNLKYSNIPKNLLENIVKSPARKVTGFATQIKDKAVKNVNDVISGRALVSNNPFIRNLAMAKYHGPKKFKQSAHFATQAIVDSLPGGFEGLFQLLRGVHRSYVPYTDAPKSPLERILEARAGQGKFPTNAFGPGNYFATSRTMSDEIFEGFGPYAYKTALTPSAVLKVLRSKGFATKNEVAKIAAKIGLPGRTLESVGPNADDPLIKGLIDAGYLGYRHNDAFTNWMMGVMPGMGFKLTKNPKFVDTLDAPKSVIKKANGGLVKGYKEGGLASRPKYGKKQNWFQRYVSNLTEGSKKTPSWARDPLGAQALLRMIAGQREEGDSFAAAMLPLNFMGAGIPGKLGLAGKAGVAGTAASQATIRPSKASKTIIRNLQGKALEFAQQEGRNIPEMVLTGRESFTDAPSTLWQTPTTDLSKAYHHYWSEAYSILTKQGDESVKGMSKQDFLNKLTMHGKGQVGSSEVKDLVPTDFIKAANKAYAQAHGLSPETKLAMFKATPAFNKLGGYWSLSSKMAAHYGSEQHLNLLNDKSGRFGSNAGLYQIDVLPEQVPTPLSIGAMSDEFTATLPPSLIEQLGGAKRIALSGKPKTVGPNRDNRLNEIYSRVAGAKPLDGMKPWELKLALTTSLVHRSLIFGQEEMIKSFLDAGLIKPKNLLSDKSSALSNFEVPKMAKGGSVKKYAMGGLIKGPGTGISDSITAGFGYAGGGSIRVSNGEYVVKASSVKDYGVDAMNAVNNGTATIGTNSGGTVYNINMPITSNNANPEIVANEVMRKLKLEVSKNNKSNKVGL